MSHREPTVSITVRFPKALAGRLGERAKQDHQSVSTLLRRYAELGLNGEDYARQTAPIRDIIREEITHSVRQQTDRIAALLIRLTILSASGYYATLAFVTAFVDQDRYTSVEKIERIARQMGLDYASGRKNLLESGISELNRAIVKRTKRPAPARREPSYEEMCSPDFDFVNYNYTDDDDND
ncbi:hypothetical protein [Lachnoclostridium edouardi]|uniref:hypothetical protein n=1 Tax=Lachnoclostridium edouardi TaxID=1926283 RepID=UPI000C79F562|nr:hypothetical protein [Lachnoclostridium edouardi]